MDAIILAYEIYQLCGFSCGNGTMGGVTCESSAENDAGSSARRAPKATKQKYLFW